MSDKRSTASNSIAAITNPSFPHPQAQCKRKRDPLLPLDPIDNNINKSSKRPRTAACAKTQTLRGSIRRRASDIIRAAWKCPDLSLLHPAAHVRDNQVIIPSVSATVFKCAQARISSSAAASKRIRLEHSRSKTSVANSKLLITMPTRIHEIMKAFASEIKSQMFTPDPHTGRAFIPGSWERSRVFETGSPSLELQYGDKTLVRQPDASLAFQPDNPFLVVEVAVTQDAEAAKRKAKEYIIGSRGKIAVVLVIVVRRLNRRAIKERTDEGRELSRAGKPSPDQQGQQHMGNQVGGVSTPSTISTLTDPPSDLSQWDVFPNQPSGALVDQASINKTTSDSSLSLPPFLYKALDTEEILNAGDTIHTSVFKAVTIPSQTSPELSTRTIHSVVEEVEVYPHTTSASFTIDWLDISKTAPRDAGPSLHVDLGPLSDLARALEAHGSGEVHDDGFRPLTDESVEYVPSSSTWGDVDWERSGGTIPSDVEKLRDPSFSP